MFLDVLIGIATSVIGGVIVAVMRPPNVSFRYIDGDLFIWAAIAVLSVVVGVLLGVVVFHTISPNIINGILFRSVKEAQPLSILLSVVVAICLGIVATVG